MYVNAVLTLDDVNNLQLSKHVLQVGLKLLGLPVAKLLVCILVAEGDCLVSLQHLRAICLLHVALHDSDHGTLPRKVTHSDQVFPLTGTPQCFSWNFEEASVLGYQDQTWTGSSELVIEFLARAWANENDTEVSLLGDQVEKADHAGEILSAR